MITKNNTRHQRVPSRKIVSFSKLIRGAQTEEDFAWTDTATVSWFFLINGTMAPKAKAVHQPRAHTNIPDHTEKPLELVLSWAQGPALELVLWTLIAPSRRQYGRPMHPRPKGWLTTMIIKVTFLCQRSSTANRNLVIKGPQIFEKFAALCLWEFGA